MNTLKALTVRQPWASLIINGYVDRSGVRVWKTVENRSWRTGYRGPVLIHSGRNLAGLADETLPNEVFTGTLDFGAILGVVTIADCVRLEDLDRSAMTEAEQSFATGPWCWILRDPVPFPESIPATGKLGLWNPDPELVARVRAGMERQL